MLSNAAAVRAKYMRARRNLEYQKLKEVEKKTDRELLDIVGLSEHDKNILEAIKNDDLVCPICSKGFKTVKGFDYHVTNKVCDK